MSTSPHSSPAGQYNMTWEVVTTEADFNAIQPVLVKWDPVTKKRNLTIGFLLVALNGLTLVTVCRTRSLRPHIKMLVGSLTCTDLLMGLVTLFPRLLPLQPLSHHPLCYLRYVGVCLSVYGTCLSITAITVDRCLAFSLPLLYRLSVSVAKASLVVAAVWGLSLALGLASLGLSFPRQTSCDMMLVMSRRGLAVMGWTLLLCGLVIGAMYVYLALNIRRRWRRVEPDVSARAAGEEVAGPGPGVAGAEVVEAPAGAQEGGQGLNLKSERRTTVTATLLTVCFLLGYLPLALYLLWAVYSGVDRLQEAHTQRLNIIIVCPLSNCFIDPIIYFWRLQNVRSGIFGRCRQWVTRGSGSSSNQGGATRMTQRTTTRT